MSNRRPPWKIPAVINPPKRRCIKIDIPDDPEHISIFWGLLRSLSDWQRWEREPTKSGTLVAQVWREVVYSIDWSIMSCCPDPTNQYYDENGVLQVSYDNGVTYQPATDDPRFNSPLLPPLTSEIGVDRRCEAANNVVGMIKDSADQLIADADNWSNMTALVAALVALLFFILEIGSGGALTLLLLPLAAALLGAGQSGLDTALTAGVYNQLLEIVYCNTPDDANYTFANWEEIQREIVGRIGGIAQTFLQYSVRGFGTAGLNNASRLGISAGLDCSEIVCNECPCDLLSWHWSPDYGTPEENSFSYDPNGCAVGAAAWHNPVDGLYYYGVVSNVPCRVISGLNAGNVDSGHGYIAGNDTSPYSWFDFNHDWLPGTINIQRNARAVIMISTTPFSAYTQLLGV